MVTAQRVSQHGHHFFQSSFEARATDVRRGSPLAIFRNVAAGVALIAVTGGALGAVALLAHLITASWRVLLMV